MSKHEFYEKFEKLHSSVASYEGGACLRGHSGFYQEKDSCSYRWQGLAKAKLEPGKDVYDSHPNPKCHLDGSGYGWASVQAVTQGRAGVVEATYAKKTYKTKKGKDIEKQKILAKNFTNGFAPYPNQVHHILPTAALRESILEVSKPAPSVAETIGKGLLGEKYNINHMDNMIILPVRGREARKIGLPTHCGSHPGYSAQIKDRVTAALRPYQRIAEQVANNRKHDSPKPGNLKDALELISDVMYIEFITVAISAKEAGVDPGSVDELPSSVFQSLDF
ncbi:AHH domain-containing protein [Sorangium sp. So ce296]|uniref:AHH domain-containing protein n=1 Tax=Sorangium sp. So ce296 TaxID=3133296 RepID=UPI003F5EA9AB